MEQLTLNDDRVVMVEFLDKQPWMVWTTGTSMGFDHYDFNYSRIYGHLCYDLSGCGPDLFWEGHKFWVDPEFERLVFRNGKARRLRVSKTASRGKRLSEPPADLQELIDDAWNTDTVWCSTCKDYLPEDAVCKHIFWCERCECRSTPGSRAGNDPDGCRHRKPPENQR